ncbi:hypothetical protein AB0N14_29355 [Streptomyces sp. NPDC051104]|uniref:hypothetical protein n=1 Tax=Streptomyces sp. NPDC051104 TaxID=3155044 RepID=UPI003429250D
MSENGPATAANPDHGSVEDWHACNDPAELRIRLDVALEENAELHAPHSPRYAPRTCACAPG